MIGCLGLPLVCLLLETSHLSEDREKKVDITINILMQCRLKFVCQNMQVKEIHRSGSVNLQKD